MIFFFAIVGLFLGGVFGGVPGALIGATLGYLFANQLSLQEKLTNLETRLKALGKAGVEPQKPVSPETEVAKPSPVAEQESEPEAAPEPQEPVPAAEPEVSAFQKVAVEDAAAVRAEPEPVGEPRINPIVAFFTGGNAAVRIGIVVLFFGIAFLLKYAIDHNKLPIELRLIAISIGAIAMLVIGWRLRESRAGYALSMQGGAIGILYLVVFAALRLYHLLPPVAAFVLLVAIAAFSAVLAILQDSLIFAVFGVVGGFLAPILTSTGSGSHVMLFSYYSVLNLGILAVAWHKSWRILNLVGFGFTFVIATLWGARSYTPQYFNSTEPFLIFFILLYVFIAVLFATRQKPELIGYVDGPIVFGTPIVGFGLQSSLVSQYEYGLAWSALAFGIFYLSLATLLFRRHSSNLKLLVQSFLGIGVLFGTLVIPLAFDGRWTSAAWAVEGSAAIWIGIQQRHRLPRLFGLLLMIGSSLAFLSDINAPVGSWPVLNSFYIGCLMICVAALFSSYQFYRNQQDIGADEASAAHPLLLILGLVWWFVGGFVELNDFVAHMYKLNSGFIFITLSSLVAVFIARRLQWKPIGFTAFGLLPAMVVAAAGMYLSVEQPMARGGFISWPLAFVAYYGLLRGNERYLTKNLTAYGHAISLWLIIFLASWQAYWAVGKVEALSHVWLEITLALVPAVFVHLVSRLSTASERWPVGVHARDYLGVAAAPVLALLWLGTLFVSVSNTGNVRPLPYIPILNVLDLTQILVFIVALNWFTKAKPMDLAVLAQERRPLLYGGAALTVFIWLNAVLLRTIHHWVGVPFTFRHMFHSILVQTSLSIFWGLLGFAVMVLANRLQKRIVWFSGALLLGVVVIKLFLVDLAQSGTIERIISFIVVGILLLVVGYFTPVPPKNQAREAGA